MTVAIAAIVAEYLSYGVRIQIVQFVDGEQTIANLYASRMLGHRTRNYLRNCVASGNFRSNDQTGALTTIQHHLHRFRMTNAVARMDCSHWGHRSLS